MIDMAHVKWYAEKLCELLEQDENNPITINLYREANIFVINNKDVEAKVPPVFMSMQIKKLTDPIRKRE